MALDLNVRVDVGVSPVAQIEALDTAIFAIQPGYYEADRISFLRVQRLVRALRPDYAYLEIGSEIGGSLLPHLLDPACVAAVSIDPRPEQQPDERGMDFHYAGNSTARMLAELGRHVTAAQLDKLATIEADASAIDPAMLGRRADLVLIDGEHTNPAAFSDFMAVLRMIADDAVVTFHDANLVGDTLQIIERFLAYQGIPYSLAILPSCVAVFGLGRFRDPVASELGPHAEPAANYYANARRQRHAAVADAVVSKTPALHGQSIAELVAWTNEAVQRFRAGDTAVAEAERLRQALDQAELVRAVLQRHLDAFVASSSWRITRPLRAAATLLRRQRP